MAYSQYPAGCQTEDNNLQSGQSRIDFIVAFQEDWYNRQIADHGGARQDGNPDEIQKVTIAEHREPGPPWLDVGMFKIVMDVHSPVIRDIFMWDIWVQYAEGVNSERDKKDREADIHPLLENRCVP